MKDLSLHVLDIVENSIAAGAKRINIIIEENTKKNLLMLKIKDNGRGIDKKTLKMVLDPFYTTRNTRRVGLGLSMLAQATKEAKGSLDIKSEIGKGTTVIAKFMYNHIDRKPIGNMVETISDLIATNGTEIDFIYQHKKNGKGFTLDTRYLKKELGDILLNNSEVLNALRKKISRELAKISKENTIRVHPRQYPRPSASSAELKRKEK